MAFCALGESSGATKFNDFFKQRLGPRPSAHVLNVKKIEDFARDDWG
jgi:hypothetical protein